MTDQNKKEGLKIVREFNAPKTLVFGAFADAAVFAGWWGPAGMAFTVNEFDFRQGGKLRYKIEGNGQVMWGLFRYGNIVAPDLIEFVSSFSDEAGNISKSPFPMDFPLEIFNHVALEENNDITTVTITGHPINATPEQQATYDSIMENMEQGFGNTFDQLAAYLARVQK